MVYISVSPDQDIGRQVSQLVRLLQDLLGAFSSHLSVCANIHNRYPKQHSLFTEAQTLCQRLVQFFVDDSMQVQ